MIPNNQVGSLFRQNGLRLTKQRQAIINIFLRSRKHLSVEELYQRVKKLSPSIGYATVYRTVKVLTRANLAEERQFGDGRSRFESVMEKKHHDHLICVKCGKIIEFENDQIEQLQEAAARHRGFKVLSHKLELYGHCTSCQ